ncbi:MAG: DNA recombination protein RmuC [Candidatus Margulisbacteria bacterium]|nr:DNA recombination protein RmuC [Candidatus Margulisiibacteriota bacterium]
MLNLFIFLFIGVGLGVAIGYLLGKMLNSNSSLKEEIAGLKVYKLEKEDLQKTCREEKELIQKRLDDSIEHFQKLKAEIARKEEENKNLVEKLQTQKQEIDERFKYLQDQFANLANKIFEEKSQKFTTQNKENIDVLLKPLQEKIQSFQKKVEDTYDDENRQRAGLKQQIEMLADLNKKMSEDAHNLTTALKGETKTQGNWGEMILETILEKSGLQKGVEFSVQESFKTEDGQQRYPDVIINLPGKKHMVIDSKVTLTAYERYISAEDADKKEKFLKEHIISLRNHIKGLSDKQYQKLYQINSPDFVLMFVAVEPAFALAVQQDNNLFYEAFERNIVIVSPSTLLATLRTIDNIWRQEKQNKNAMEIAKRAGDMYDKFVNFVDDLKKLGNQLLTTQRTYDEAMKKLSTGTGSLVIRAEGIKKLGAKTAKSLSVDSLEDVDLIEEESRE